MKMKWMAALAEAGVDTESALRRFSGNSALYRKLLLMFPQDDTFEQLKAAMQADDWAAVLIAAHTLKGVAGNLGMNSLFDACSDTVSLMRAEDYGNAAEAYEKLKRTYEEIIKAVSLIEEAE